MQADITFRSCYQLTNLEKLEILAAWLTRNKPAMWGDVAFYGLLLLLYTLSLLGLFWKLTQLVLEQNNN